MNFAYQGQQIGLRLPQGLATSSDTTGQLANPPVVRLSRFEDAFGSAATRAVIVYGADAKTVGIREAIEDAVNDATRLYGEILFGHLQLSETKIGGVGANQSTLAQAGTIFRYHAIAFNKGTKRFTVVLWTLRKAKLSPPIIKPNGC